jgi:hypothetical protein
MHGALPQAFLHLRALADIEDRLVDGTGINNTLRQSFCQRLT